MTTYHYCNIFQTGLCQQGEEFPKNSGWGGGVGWWGDVPAVFGCVYCSQCQTGRAATVNIVIDLMKMSAGCFWPLLQCRVKFVID